MTRNHLGFSSQGVDNLPKSAIPKSRGAIANSKIRMIRDASSGVN